MKGILTELFWTLSRSIRHDSLHVKMTSFERRALPRLEDRSFEQRRLVTWRSSMLSALLDRFELAEAAAEKAFADAEVCFTWSCNVSSACPCAKGSWP